MARVDGKQVMLGIVCLLGMLALPPWGWGQTGDRIGTVLAVEGVAEVQAAQATEWERLRYRDGIFLNDTVRTAAESKLKVLLRDDSIMALAEQSEMQFTEFLLTEQQRRSVVNMLVGKVRLLTARLFGAGSLAEVHTPNAVAGVRGSDEHIQYNPQTRQTTVYCASGGDLQDDHCYLRDRTNASKFLNIPPGHIAEQAGAVLPSTTREITASELQAIVESTQITEQDPQETMPTDEQPPSGLPRGETADTMPTGPPPSTMVATAVIPTVPDFLPETLVSLLTTSPLNWKDNPQNLAIPSAEVTPLGQTFIQVHNQATGSSGVGVVITIPR